VDRLAQADLQVQVAHLVLADRLEHPEVVDRLAQADLQVQVAHPEAVDRLVHLGRGLYQGELKTM
jgi:hypothetical protein